MRERNIQIELTPQEAMLQSAACAIATVISEHPGAYVTEFPPHESEVLVMAAIEILQYHDDWKIYLEKQLLAVQKIRTGEGT